MVLHIGMIANSILADKFKMVFQLLAHTYIVTNLQCGFNKLAILSNQTNMLCKIG